MASPQIEDGYTKIANEIMDALCRTRIPGEQRQVLDAIIRKTYGWGKCEDKISLGQIALMTGMKRSNVARSLKSLLSKQIACVIKSDSTNINLLKFNKNYDDWMLSKVIPVIKSDSISVIKSDTHKRKERKEKKESIPKIDLPNWIPRLTWDEYLAMRRNIKKPLLEKSYIRVWGSLKRLCEGSGNNAEAILNQSIVNSWQGLFPLKNVEQKKESW